MIIINSNSFGLTIAEKEKLRLKVNLDWNNPLQIDRKELKLFLDSDLMNKYCEKTYKKCGFSFNVNQLGYYSILISRLYKIYTKKVKIKMIFDDIFSLLIKPMMIALSVIIIILFFAL